MVVTGGAGALGREVVATLVRAGAICHLPVRDEVTITPAVAASVHVVSGVDLADESAVVRFYSKVPADLWASVHVAGSFAMGGITETSLADLRAQIDVNLVTAFLCCREAVRRFRMRAGGGGGRLVNVVSRAALQPGPRASAYNLSKAAVVSLTQTLAAELKTEGILVNAVAPGMIDTAANRAAMPGLDAAHAVAPAAIATAIAWLASPQNAIASGAVVPVYGNS